MAIVKSDAPANGSAAAAPAGSPRASFRNFCVAHLSDLHLFNPGHMQAGDFLGKRALAYLSWLLHHRSRRRTGFLPALRKAIGAAGVDHIVITGDLTHMGHQPDFDAAGELLEDLGGPERITLIPGNHDACVAMPWLEDTFSLQAYMSSDRPGDGAAGSSASMKTAPTLRRRLRAAIIGLSTACPTPPFLATGAIGPGQLERLERILERTSSEGLFRMILVHHPPVREAVSHRRRLTDQHAFADIIRRQGAELILHGHAHRSCQSALQGPHGKIPVIGAPPVTALSARTRRHAGFHLYRIRAARGRWTVELTPHRFCRSRKAFLPVESVPLSIPGPAQ